MIEEVSGKDELLEQAAPSLEGDAKTAQGALTPDVDADVGSDEAAPSTEDSPSKKAGDESAAEFAPHDPTGQDADETDSDNEADDADDEFVGHAEPIELVQELVEDEELEMQWFILKVASNRENSIADALRRRIKVEGLDRYVGQIIVPTEDVQEFKSGKRKVVKRKLYPGYICVEMHVNDDTWFAVRDTPGIGDFTGAAGKPTPMLDHEIERILPKPDGPDPEKAVKSVIKFKVEDHVRIKEGTFENFEGRVEAIDEANGRVTVEINIFDRPTPVEIDHWQLEAV